MRFRAHLLALLLLALPCRAEDPLPAEMQVLDGGVRDDAKGSAFWLEVQTNLPENTSIELEGWLGATKLDAAMTRAYVAKTGKCVVTLGPFEKPLLPAEYQIKAIVHSGTGRQDRALEEYFRAWGGRDLVEARPVRLGTPEQEAEARKKEDDLILSWVKRAEALQDEVVKAGDDYRAKKGWHTPNDGSGKFDPKAFLAWAEATLEKLWALQAERDQYYNGYAATYRNDVWLSNMPEVFLSLRLITIDYLIVTICKRNQLALPQRTETVDAFMKPPRDACIEKNRGLFKEVCRALGAWKGEHSFDELILAPAKCPAGYGLAHLPAGLAALAANPYKGAPPAMEACTAFGEWFGAAPIRDATLDMWCLFLSAGSTAVKWDDPKEAAPDLKGFDPHVGVYAFDFSSENAVANFVERLRGLKKQGKRPNLAFVRKEFLVVVIDRLDDKGADGFNLLKARYEQALGASAE